MFCNTKSNFWLENHYNSLSRLHLTSTFSGALHAPLALQYWNARGESGNKKCFTQLIHTIESVFYILNQEMSLTNNVDETFVTLQQAFGFRWNSAIDICFFITIPSYCVFRNLQFTYRAVFSASITEFDKRPPTRKTSRKSLIFQLLSTYFIQRWKSNKKSLCPIQQIEGFKTAISVTCDVVQVL